MEPSPPLKFDSEITIGEIAGIGRHDAFAVVDDKEYYAIQVIFQRGGEEIPHSKPSRAFYVGDRNLHDQEAMRFDKEEKARILNTDQFPLNLARFEELKHSASHGATTTLSLSSSVCLNCREA
jgi:hypothetical protein